MVVAVGINGALLGGVAGFTFGGWIARLRGKVMLSPNQGVHSSLAFGLRMGLVGLGLCAPAWIVSRQVGIDLMGLVAHVAHARLWGPRRDPPRGPPGPARLAGLRATAIRSLSEPRREFGVPSTFRRRLPFHPSHFPGAPHRQARPLNTKDISDHL
jgi:hypothetical protein